ncbi:hypothetical protein [Acinetobacter gerneri]|uniref:hypothetical protein n=1 Tax=Acinetobacter gerneri TaxID=202952 RepID=UPI00321514EE
MLYNKSQSTSQIRNMPHRVFLTSCPFDHMPLGHLNQWKVFAEVPRPELEANSFLPILWLMMFKQDHIQWARFIDDFDIDDENVAAERQSCLENFGTESEYPYLITDTASALQLLKQRKAEFLQITGDQYTDIYHEFEIMVEKYYPDHVLLRTLGLPDINQAENWLQNSMIPLEALGTGHSLQKNPIFWKRFLNDLHQYPHEVQYFLRGYSRAKAKVFPQSSELQQIREHPSHIQDSPAFIPQSLFLLLFLILGIFAAIATYLYSASIIYSFIALMVVAGLCTYIFIRINEINHAD